jgi:uncharacterized protein (TIGR02996 family)
MSDAAFLDAILTHPDDDGPRLVYADWLDEQGDPRGEFIRLQCELARLPESDAPQPTDLERREWELLQRHGDAWDEPMPGRAESWEFRRGFIAWALFRPQQLLDHGPYLAGSVPTLDAISVLDPGGRVRELLDSPLLARAVHLAFKYTPHETSSTDPITMQTRITRYVRPEDALRPTDWAALAAAPPLPRLRSLSLAWTGVDSSAARHLTAAPLLAPVRRLDLTGCGMDDEAVAVLANSPRAAGLERIDLGRNHLGPVGIAALADSPHLGSLKHLDLSGVPLGPAALPALSRLVVRFLNRRGGDGTRAAAILARPGSRTAALERLDLRDTGFSPADRDFLRAQFGDRVLL